MIPTFEDAIATTQVLLPHLIAGDWADAELEAAIATLVSSENGARGFFVTYLTGDSPVLDTPPSAVLRALKSAPEIVSELLVKNLAMSSAMAVFHRRQQHEDRALGSDRVRSRTMGLIQQLQLAPVAERLQQMRQTLADGGGPYAGFLERWGYDAEQKQAIQQALDSVVG